MELVDEEIMPERSLDSIIKTEFEDVFKTYGDSKNFPAVDRIYEIASFWVSEIINLITINDVDIKS